MEGFLFPSEQNKFNLSGNDTWNMTLDVYDAEPSSSPYVTIVAPIFFGLILLTALVGNALVVIVVSTNRKMRNTTNLLILNLAVADLLFNVFCVTFGIIDYAVPFWLFGDAWCKCLQYLLVVTINISAFTLVLLSLDRLLASVQSTIRTKTNALIAIAVTWLVILTACVPYFLCHGEVTITYGATDHAICVFLERDIVTRPDGYNKMAYQMIFLMMSYVVPLLLIGAVFLLRAVRRGRGRDASGTERATRLVAVLCAVYAACWLPTHMMMMFRSLGQFEITDTIILLEVVSQILAFATWSVYPILYACLSDSFRQAFRQVRHCGRGSGGRYQRASGRQGDADMTCTKANIARNDDFA